MITSQCYLLAMMVLGAFLACVWIPFNMNEYGLPIFFRETNSNVWLDFLLLRICAFFFFMIMAGCLPQLIFYATGPKQTCLNTSHPQFINIVWTDNYQFVLACLTWAVTVPAFIFLILRLCGDALRFSCVPVIIAMSIFLVMITVIALIIIFEAIVSASHPIL